MRSLTGPPRRVLQRGTIAAVGNFSESLFQRRCTATYLAHSPSQGSRDMAAFPSPFAVLARRPVAWLQIAGWLCASVAAGQLVVSGSQAAAARPEVLQPPPQGKAAAQAEAPATPGQRAQIEALQPWAGLVGQWRGVGQPTRGSNKGAWSETANWQWDLSDNSASLKLVVAEGKQLTGGHLRWLAAEKQFEFAAQLPGGAKQTFRGVRNDNKLVLDALSDQAEAPLQRVVVTQLNDNRSLLLFQSKGPRQSAHQRIAEVGYTRAGTRLAREGADSPVCVVTGGRGTIEVQFEGQTYWVCCTGCQDAFEEDPKGIIAAFKERQKAESAPKPR